MMILTKPCIFVALSAALCSGDAAAQSYPAKPVRIIVPYAPGGGVDIMARIAAQKFGERMGAQFVVDNRVGGGTVIGTEIVARAPSDGHTLLFANPGLTSSVALNQKLPFDPVQSFAPVGLFASSFNVLIVHPSVPVKSLKELIALAKSQPRQLNYASAGNGSATHLVMELFQSATGIDLVHIPYKGAGPALNDVLGGQLTIKFSTTPSILEHLRNGRLRALAVSSAKRLSVLPQVPTIAESGYPGFEVNNWYGIVAPAHTPPEIVGGLNREMNAMLGAGDVKERVIALGNEPTGGTAEQFAERIRKEVVLWQTLFAGLKAKPSK
jgi:tripartite-type tricarboxylate transporter receptor subunit TctC